MQPVSAFWTPPHDRPPDIPHNLFFLEEMCMGVSFDEMAVKHQRKMHGERRLDTQEDIFINRTPHPLNRLCSGEAISAEF